MFKRHFSFEAEPSIKDSIIICSRNKTRIEYNDLEIQKLIDAKVECSVFEEK
jgi:hypothetical protein